MFTHQSRSRRDGVGIRRGRWGAGDEETKSWGRSEVRATKPPGSWLCCSMRPETQEGKGPAHPTQPPPSPPASALGSCHLWPENSPQTRRCLKIETQVGGKGGRRGALHGNEEQRSWGRRGDREKHNKRHRGSDQDRERDREKRRERGETQRHKEKKRARAPSQAVTEQALPKGGASLESSQRGESQAALEIWGREGGSGGKQWGMSLPTESQRLCPGSHAPPAPPGGCP